MGRPQLVVVNDCSDAKQLARQIPAHHPPPAQKLYRHLCSLWRQSHTNGDGGLAARPDRQVHKQSIAADVACPAPYRAEAPGAALPTHLHRQMDRKSKTFAKMIHVSVNPQGAVSGSRREPGGISALRLEACRSFCKV